MKKLLCQIGTTLSALGILMVMGALFEGTMRVSVAVPVLGLLCVVAWVLCQLPYVHIRWEGAVRPAAGAKKRTYAAQASSRAVHAGRAA